MKKGIVHRAVPFFCVSAKVDNIKGRCRGLGYAFVCPRDRATPTKVMTIKFPYQRPPKCCIIPYMPRNEDMHRPHGGKNKERL